MNSSHFSDSKATPNGIKSNYSTSPAPEDSFGERTLHFVAESCSVPERSGTAIGECTINTRNLQIADAIATYRKLAPKSTI